MWLVCKVIFLIFCKKIKIFVEQSTCRFEMGQKEPGKGGKLREIKDLRDFSGGFQQLLELFDQFPASQAGYADAFCLGSLAAEDLNLDLGGA